MFVASRIERVTAARNDKVESRFQYRLPRRASTSTGTATCSLAVRWWYPSRSAAVATATRSSTDASISHSLWDLGNKMTIGVMIPIRVTPPRPK